MGSGSSSADIALGVGEVNDSWSIWESSTSSVVGGTLWLGLGDELSVAVLALPQEACDNTALATEVGLDVSDAFEGESLIVMSAFATGFGWMVDGGCRIFGESHSFRRVIFGGGINHFDELALTGGP